MKKHLSHISIVVPDLEVAIKTMREVYGLASGDIAENVRQGVRLTYIDLGNSKIELMQPLTVDSPVGRFLAKHPAGGLHHLCLGVSEIVPVTTELRQKGVRVLGNGMPAYNSHGQEIAFIHPSDFFGALVEIEQQSREPEGST
jgi:methylmalonyl-CoA/ethylmalonyl-CoA epimerase